MSVSDAGSGRARRRRLPDASTILKLASSSLQFIGLLLHAASHYLSPSTLSVETGIRRRYLSATICLALVTTPTPPSLLTLMVSPKATQLSSTPPPSSGRISVAGTINLLLQNLPPDEMKSIEKTQTAAISDSAPTYTWTSSTVSFRPRPSLVSARGQPPQSHRGRAKGETLAKAHHLLGPLKVKKGTCLNLLGFSWNTWQRPNFGLAPEQKKLAEGLFVWRCVVSVMKPSTFLPPSSSFDSESITLCDRYYRFAGLFRNENPRPPDLNLHRPWGPSPHHELYDGDLLPLFYPISHQLPSEIYLYRFILAIGASDDIKHLPRQEHSQSRTRLTRVRVSSSSSLGWENLNDMKLFRYCVVDLHGEPPPKHTQSKIATGEQVPVRLRSERHREQRYVALLVLCAPVSFASLVQVRNTWFSWVLSREDIVSIKEPTKTEELKYRPTRPLSGSLHEKALSSPLWIVSVNPASKGPMDNNVQVWQYATVGHGELLHHLSFRTERVTHPSFGKRGDLQPSFGIGYPTSHVLMTKLTMLSAVSRGHRHLRLDSNQCQDIESMDQTSGIFRISLDIGSLSSLVIFCYSRCVSRWNVTKLKK